MIRRMNSKTVTIDVREDIRSGREPFSKIMGAVSALRANEQLRLIAPFEPVPLVAVLAKQGFTHSAKAVGAGDWEVVFTPNGQKTENPRPEIQTHPSPFTPAATEIVEVDARGLEPPQPLVKILEAVATLPAGSRVLARTDRRPMHLYAQLEERGFVAETQEQSDGSFVTHISRR